MVKYLRFQPDAVGAMTADDVAYWMDAALQLSAEEEARMKEATKPDG